MAGRPATSLFPCTLSRLTSQLEQQATALMVRAQDGDAVDAALQIEIHQAVGGLEVDLALIRERRGGDDVDALGGFIEEFDGHMRFP